MFDKNRVLSVNGGKPRTGKDGENVCIFSVCLLKAKLFVFNVKLCMQFQEFVCVCENN